MYIERQIATSKAGVTAVTVLNTGSWLALLSQAAKLSELPKADMAAYALGAWGVGAIFGTITWLAIYFNIQALCKHDFDRDNRRFNALIDLTMYIGLAMVIGAMLCYVAGLVFLSAAIRS